MSLWDLWPGVVPQSKGRGYKFSVLTLVTWNDPQKDLTRENLRSSIIGHNHRVWARSIGTEGIYLLFRNLLSTTQLKSLNYHKDKLMSQKKANMSITKFTQGQERIKTRSSPTLQKIPHSRRIVVSTITQLIIK